MCGIIAVGAATGAWLAHDGSLVGLHWERSAQAAQDSNSAEQRLAQQIETFKPHAVISVHAPHGVVDFDGPRVPPRQLGPLELRLLGTYPGSMGRYIGVHKGIPLLTVELESAFGMPQRDQIYDIWYDMLGWLHEKIARPMQLAEQQRALEAPSELLRVEAGPDNGG